MSRRKSRNEMPAVHEALSTSRAGFCFVSKSSSFASCTFTLAMLWSRISFVSNCRSCGLAARIANGTGRAAGHGNGMMAEQLKPPQREQRHEIADVQAVRRRVEAAVKRDGRGDFLFQFRRVGAIGDEAAPFQFFQNAHAGRLNCRPANANFQLAASRSSSRVSICSRSRLTARTLGNFGLWTLDFGL